jgi:hypothetical protein
MGQGKVMRWMGLLAVGAIGLHELRYVFGSAAHGAASHAHSYLPLVIALAALAFVVALVDFITTVAAARGAGAHHESSSRVSKTWPTATFALIAIFVLQESLEGALFGGHSAGLHGLFGHGGWWVLVFAPILGGLVAFALRGSDKAIALAAGRPARRRRKPARVISARPTLFTAPRLRLLARHLAGRAPPLAS